MDMLSAQLPAVHSTALATKLFSILQDQLAETAETVEIDQPAAPWTGPGPTGLVRATPSDLRVEPYLHRFHFLTPVLYLGGRTPVTVKSHANGKVRIEMPHLSCFGCEHSFAAVLAHEAAHWVGWATYHSRDPVLEETIAHETALCLFGYWGWPIRQFQRNYLRGALEREPHDVEIATFFAVPRTVALIGLSEGKFGYEEIRRDRV